MTWQALPPGTVIGGVYEIIRLIGSGGFGITYQAWDHERSEVVAIKEYFPRTAATRVDGWVYIASVEQQEIFDRQLDRFWTEAWNLNRFNHPHIVKFRHRFAENGTAYIALEFIDGVNLDAWAQTNPPPAATELDGFSSAFLDAIETIHRNNLLHRDIAPKNVLLRDGFPVLVDFGSARDLDPNKPMTAMVSAHYAPYEQYLTSASYQGPWTDIYAAGATLYRLIVGKPPADAVTRSVDETKYERVAVIGQGRYRQSFLEAIDWALEHDYRRRPATVAEWRGPLLLGTIAAARRSGLSTPIMPVPKPNVVDRMKRFFNGKVTERIEYEN